MKQATIAIRNSPPIPASSSPLPELDPVRLAALLAAPALGETPIAVEPEHQAESPPAKPNAKTGRQRRDTPRRRADRDEGNLTRLQIHLSADVAKALRVLAATEGRSLSSTVEAELRGLLKRRGAL